MLVRFSSNVALRYLLVASLRGAVVAAPALGIALCPASAHAQDKKELSKARAMFQRAIELEQAGNYATALELFRSVGEVRMTPQVRFHIASCEEKLGRLVTALGGYQLAFADADGVGEDFKAEVERAVTRLQASIPKLVIQRGAGAEAAEIQLDGVAIGASSVGVPVPLDPGPHAITAKAPGMLPFNQTVTVSENAETKLNVELEAEPVQDDPLRFNARQVDRPKTNVLPYVIGGVGVASLIGSGVLFALRQTTLSDLEKKCENLTCPSSASGQNQNLKVYNVAAQVTLGVGIAGVGTAVALLIIQKKHAQPAPTSGFTVVPSAPNSVAGMSLAGHF